PIHPLSVYGKTKLEGDEAIQASGCRHLIFRTSWVYGATGNNFARTMIRLGKTKSELKIVNDQFGAPTGAELLADMTALALRAVQQKPELKGLYHLAAGGETNWFEYARYVLAYARTKTELAVPAEKILPIPTSAYPTPAKRPLNSRLNTAKIR